MTYLPPLGSGGIPSRIPSRTRSDRLSRDGPGLLPVRFHRPLQRLEIPLDGHFPDPALQHRPPRGVALLPDNRLQQGKGHLRLPRLRQHPGSEPRQVRRAPGRPRRLRHRPSTRHPVTEGEVVREPHVEGEAPVGRVLLLAASENVQRLLRMRRRLSEDQAAEEIGNLELRVEVRYDVQKLVQAVVLPRGHLPVSRSPGPPRARRRRPERSGTRTRTPASG